ncbi:MAG: hypothetical protein V9E99_12515 [Microthrixaceae bacterium]
MNQRLILASLSRAMDGGLTAIAEVTQILRDAGQLDRSRLIGGVAVLLHQQRLGIDLPLRATGDADFGVPPVLLREPNLVAAIEALGYAKTAGNRWERPIDAVRTSTVDLLIPAYRSRARHTVRVGDIVTTEVPGLAEALRRPGTEVDADIALTDGTSLHAALLIPDAIATLGLKGWARTVRSEDRDAEDLWRCLEIAHADGVTAETFSDYATESGVRPILARELGPSGPAMAVITRGLGENEAARRRTRIRSLLSAVAGITS